MKTIKVCSTRPEAEMYASILESNSIPCLVQADDCGGIRPYMLVNTGVIVLVNDDEYEKADALLNEMKEE